jgi:hypothetical protein
MFARLTEDFEADKHLIPKDKLIELRYEDLVKDPIATLRDLYRRLDIGDFETARPRMQAYLDAQNDHRVSEYELPPELKRRVIERLKPYIDRYGYRDAVGGEGTRTRSAKVSRETQPS